VNPRRLQGIFDEETMRGSISSSVYLSVLRNKMLADKTRKETDFALQSVHLVRKLAYLGCRVVLTLRRFLHHSLQSFAGEVRYAAPSHGRIAIPDQIIFDFRDTNTDHLCFSFGHEIRPEWGNEPPGPGWAGWRFYCVAMLYRDDERPASPSPAQSPLKQNAAEDLST